MLILLFSLLSFLKPVQALEISSGDGLSVQLTEDGGIYSLMVDAEPLELTQTGGFYLADVAGIDAAEVELLPDAGFEKLAQDDATGWQVGNDWTPDTMVYHSGNAAMHVQVPGPQPRPSGNLTAVVDVRPNRLYRVTIWMKTKDCAPYMYLVQRDAQGSTRLENPQICVSHNKKNDDWFQLSYDLVTAPFCQKLEVYCNIWDQTGEAWVDDFSVLELHDDYITPQELVTGAVQKTANGLTQISNIENKNLRLTANYRTLETGIEVSGEVEDTSGQDRAVSLSFRLPVEATGWNWHDDINTRQVIHPDGSYGAARVYGDRRLIGIYPFAVIDDSEQGLALAIPMDMPRVFRLCYEPEIGFYVNYEFSLTTAATKWPGKASFKFVIYRPDAKWGMRSAAEKYYRLFPQFFEKRLERQGTAGFMDALAEESLRTYDHPAGAIWNYHKRDSKENYQRDLTKLYSYTEFSGWWGWALGVTPEEAQTKPTYEQAWERVEKFAKEEADKGEIARCILNCTPHDRNGNPMLHNDYVAGYGGYNYLCNPDPEIPGDNRYKLTLKHEVSQVDGFGLDGIYLDCVFVFAQDNFRREHFQWSDNPPVFDHQTKKPVMPMAFSIYECAKQLCDDIHAQGRTVMSNYSVTDYPTDLFSIQFIDLIGNEMLYTWTTDAKFALQRTLAHQKTVSMSWQEAKCDWDVERIEREFKQAMFYGTFYHLSRLAPVITRKWEPVTLRLAKAGWEPVTGASVDEPVRVERFGKPETRDLFFTLRNIQDTEQNVQLHVEQSLLRDDAQIWQVLDAMRYKPLESVTSKTGSILTLTVPAGDTVVLRVGSNNDLMREQLATAATYLLRADNYYIALKNAGIEVDAPDFAMLNDKITRLLQQDAIISTEALAELSMACRQEIIADIPAEQAEHSLWLERVIDRLEVACLHIEAAGEL